MNLSSAPNRPSVCWRPHAAALGLFFALALWAVYPLWLAPNRIEFPGDPLLNSWILAWDQYAFFHQIGAFFQANVFWPNADSLAYGEHMLSQAVLALPFRLFVSHPAGIHNLSLIQSFFLSAAAAYALAFFYFRASLPSTVCGLAYGFAAYRISQIWHVQLTHGEFLPLLVLGLELLLAGSRRAGWWLLFGGALGQALTSWYWAVFTFWCAGPYLAARLWQRRAELTPRRLGLIVSAPLAAAAATLPAALPYLRLKLNNALYRPADIADSLAARPLDYFVPHARSLFYGWLTRGRPELHGLECAMFPGLFLGCGFLAGLALVVRRGTGEAPAPLPLRLWGAISIFLISLTFGYHSSLRGVTLPLPLALLRWFPTIDQMRVPARWILPALLGMALLAAEAWRRLWLARGRAARLMAAAAFVLLLAESITRPANSVEVMAARPAALEWLNAQPNPTPGMILPAEHESLMLELAWLRQPMANGSNGYFPLLHMQMLRMIQENFPNAQALGILRGLGIRYVLINRGVKLTTADWTAARLAEVLAALPKDLQKKEMGQYTIVDLGEQLPLDPGRIAQFYLGLQKQIYDYNMKEQAK